MMRVGFIQVNPSNFPSTFTKGLSSIYSANGPTLTSNWISLFDLRTHLGDLGRVDNDGFFYVCGRIKELIVTAGGNFFREKLSCQRKCFQNSNPSKGENIAPVPIEEAIKEELQVFKAIFMIYLISIAIYPLSRS